MYKVSCIIVALTLGMLKTFDSVLYPIFFSLTALTIASESHCLRFAIWNVQKQTNHFDGFHRHEKENVPNFVSGTKLGPT